MAAGEFTERMLLYPKKAQHIFLIIAPGQEFFVLNKQITNKLRQARVEEPWAIVIRQVEVNAKYNIANWRQMSVKIGSILWAKEGGEGKSRQSIEAALWGLPGSSCANCFESTAWNP